jgi:hypothetical protein
MSGLMHNPFKGVDFLSNHPLLEEEDEITAVDIVLPRELLITETEHIETALTDTKQMVPGRSVEECWKVYTDPKQSHTLLNDDELKLMMHSIVQCRHENAMNIRGTNDQDMPLLRITALILKRAYADLELWAKGRGLTDYPSLQ